MQLARGGETSHHKEYTPSREDCKSVSPKFWFLFSFQDVLELLDLVHGAVKARIQLGFDFVGDNVYNLKPMIKDLQIKVGEHTKPLITSTLIDPIETRNMRI